MQVWDVLSNKEVVNIVASAPSRATAARALVDCAVRAWRLKFPTSKNDDCAVVCLFLNGISSREIHGNATEKTSKKSMEATETTDGKYQGINSLGSSFMEETMAVTSSKDGKLPDRCQSTRSLAHCISTTEDEEWSALEGFTRVNSLLNVPRFSSGDKNSASWRKWL